MKTNKDVEDLEKLIGQLHGLHSEISLLAKKAPNNGLNAFKLKIVNQVLKNGNAILTGRYKPLDDFVQFDEIELPTNSDVTMVLAQYMEQAERFRSDHVTYYDYEWYYVVDGEASDIRAKAPTKVGPESKK